MAHKCIRKTLSSAYGEDKIDYGRWWQMVGCLSGEMTHKVRSE